MAPKVKCDTPHGRGDILATRRSFGSLDLYIVGSSYSGWFSEGEVSGLDPNCSFCHEGTMVPATEDEAGDDRPDLICTACEEVVEGQPQQVVHKAVAVRSSMSYGASPLDDGFGDEPEFEKDGDLEPHLSPKDPWVHDEVKKFNNRFEPLPTDPLLNQDGSNKYQSAHPDCGACYGNGFQHTHASSPFLDDKTPSDPDWLKDGETPVVKMMGDDYGPITGSATMAYSDWAGAISSLIPGTTPVKNIEVMYYKGLSPRDAAERINSGRLMSDGPQVVPASEWDPKREASLNSTLGYDDPQQFADDEWQWQNTPDHEACPDCGSRNIGPAKDQVTGLCDDCGGDFDIKDHDRGPGGKNYTGSATAAGGPILPKLPSPKLPDIKVPGLTNTKPGGDGEDKLPAEPKVDEAAGDTHWKKDSAERFILGRLYILATGGEKDQRDEYLEWLADRDARDTQGGKEDYWKGFESPGGADLKSTPDHVQRGARDAYDQGWDERGPRKGLDNARKVVDDHYKSFISDTEEFQKSFTLTKSIADNQRVAGLTVTSHWRDVRRKALRLRSTGQVSVQHYNPEIIFGKVVGDHGTYDCTIHRLAGDKSLDHTVSNWQCNCEWGHWAWNRRSYFGRMCSHALAMYYEMQSRHLMKPGSRRHRKMVREELSNNLQALTMVISGDSKCEKCEGSGLHPKFYNRYCPDCGGSGKGGPRSNGDDNSHIFNSDGDYIPTPKRTSTLFDGPDTSDAVGGGNTKDEDSMIECLICGDPLLYTDTACPNCGLQVSDAEQASNWEPSSIEHPNRMAAVNEVARRSPQQGTPATVTEDDFDEDGGRGNGGSHLKAGETVDVLHHTDPNEDMDGTSWAVVRHPDGGTHMIHPDKLQASSRRTADFSGLHCDTCDAHFEDADIPDHIGAGADCPDCDGGMLQDPNRGRQGPHNEGPGRYDRTAKTACPKCGSADTRMTEHEHEPMVCNGCRNRWESSVTATNPGGPRAGGDKRGSAASRRARKNWMLSPGGGFGGDGSTVPCVHCGDDLSFETVEADRIEPGGSYRRENVQPACRDCNLDRSNKSDWDGPKKNQGQGSKDDYAKAAATKTPYPDPDAIEDYRGRCVCGSDLVSKDRNGLFYDAAGNNFNADDGFHYHKPEPKNAFQQAPTQRAASVEWDERREAALTATSYEFPYAHTPADNRSTPFDNTIDRPVQTVEDPEGKHDQSWLGETNDPSLTQFQCPDCDLWFNATQLEFNPGNLEDDFFCPNCSHQGPVDDFTTRHASVEADNMGMGGVGGGPDMLSPDEYGQNGANPVEPGINDNLNMGGGPGQNTAPQMEQNLMGLQMNPSEVVNTDPDGTRPNQNGSRTVAVNELDEDEEAELEGRISKPRNASHTEGAGLPSSVAGIWAAAGVSDPDEVVGEMGAGSDDQAMAAMAEQAIANLTAGRPAVSGGGRDLAKIAGRKFNPAEQDALINEAGTARNIGDLNISGTHYEGIDLEDAGAVFL